MICYLVGSRIRTVRGDVAVEELAVGDMVLTQQGGQLVPEPVVWVGNWSLDLRQEENPEWNAPIRVRKDAIAEGQPSSDLLVSPDHCLLVDGKLVPAKLLVNGGSIVQDDHVDHVHYYHVELDAHRVLIAQGAAAESYLDTGNRADFDISTAMTDDLTRRTETATPARWTQDAAAPLATATADVEPIWKALALRSTRLGFPARQVSTVADPNLFLMADGKEIRAIEQNDRRAVFVVPAGAATISLMSRSVVPQALPAFSTDTRRLGVAVRSITIGSADGEYVIAADDPALGRGWHDAETDGATAWRWTSGSAELPIRSAGKPTTVTIRFSTAPAYFAEEKVTRAA